MPSYTVLLAIVSVILIIILIAYGLVIYGLRDVFFAGQDIGSRLASYVSLPDESNQRMDGQRRKAGLLRLRLRMNNMLSGLASEKLNLQLISANWPITETEYVLIRYGSIVLAFVLGVVITKMFVSGSDVLVFGPGLTISRTIVSGISLAVIAIFIPDLLLKRSITQRRMNFGKQLVDVLILMTGAVRAGYSLPQAIEVVSKEMRSPASEEFRRVRHEIGLGLSLSQALNNLVARMENDDLYLVVTAININSQVGGNIVTMLEAVTDTIRERVRLFSEIRVLTAQQRFGSYILTFMPVGMAAAMFFINPDYMMRLFEPQILCIPIGAVIMVIFGNIAVRRLAKIDV
ncbi:MAG: type II secretion system F family protein [Anaerolineales bacterium]|jgi:tight adherence protein B